MRVGFGQFRDPLPEYLQFAAQFGATDVLLNTANLPSDNGRWELDDLVKLRKDIEQYGLKLAALENVPVSFYDDVMLGGPRRDEQIENMVYTIRNMARAGIPIFGYHWMPSHVWRTTPAEIRCGAVATAFDYAEAEQKPISHGASIAKRKFGRISNTGSSSSHPLPKKKASAWASIPAIRRWRGLAAFPCSSATSTPTSASSRFTHPTATPSNSAKARLPRCRARTSTR